MLRMSYIKYPQARANKSPTGTALPVYLRFPFVVPLPLPPSLLPSKEKANPDDGKDGNITLKVVACSISRKRVRQKREDHRNLQHFFDIAIAYT